MCTPIYLTLPSLSQLAPGIRKRLVHDHHKRPLTSVLGDAASRTYSGARLKYQGDEGSCGSPVMGPSVLLLHVLLNHQSQWLLQTRQPCGICVTFATRGHFLSSPSPGSFCLLSVAWERACRTKTLSSPQAHDVLLLPPSPVFCLTFQSLKTKAKEETFYWQFFAFHPPANFLQDRENEAQLFV